MGYVGHDYAIFAGILGRFKSCLLYIICLFFVYREGNLGLTA